jgi:hypothetical protein
MRAAFSFGALPMNAFLGLFIALSLSALSACNREEQIEGPTVAESRLLDDTETMLDNLATNEKRPANAEAPTGPKHRGDEPAEGSETGTH